MPISIACDKCGKRYSVNESVLGKRVTCKQCTQSFVARAAESKATPAPSAKATSKTAAAAPRAAVSAKSAARAAAAPPKPARQIPTPEAYDVADNWADLESASASTGPEVVESPEPAISAKRSVSVGEHAAAASAFLSRLSAGTITRMSAVALALLFVLATLVTANARVAGEVFFAAGSFVYFFVGLIVIVVRGLRAEGEGRISPGAVLGLVVSVILSVLARRPVFLFRRGRGGGIPAGKILGLFGNAVFIFLMVIVVGMLPIIFGSHLAMPDPSGSHFSMTQTPMFQPPAYHAPPPLDERYAADQIVTVNIKGLTDSSRQGSWLCGHLSQLTHTGSAQGNGGKDQSIYTVRVAPISDPNDLALLIDFGTAVVQADTRTITVQADMAKLNALLDADPSQHRNPVPDQNISPLKPDVVQSTPPQSPGNKSAALKPMPNPAEPGMKVKVLWGGQWWPAKVPAAFWKWQAADFRSNQSGSGRFTPAKMTAPASPPAARQALHRWASAESPS